MTAGVTLAADPDAFPFNIATRKSGDPETWRQVLAQALIYHTPQTPLVRKRGRFGRWLIDMRVPMMQGDKAAFVGRLMAEELRERGATAVAAHGIAGSMLVGATLAAAPELEGCIVRNSPKPYDRRRIVEGARPESVVLIDDLLNRGRSKKHSIPVLRNEGIEVTGVLVAVCYGWARGLREMEDIGMPVDYLVRLERRPRADTTDEPDGTEPG